jgi:hypothetical protein
LGPDLLRYLPISESLSDELAQLALKPSDEIDFSVDLSLSQQLEVFGRPLGAAYSVIFRQLVVPVWPVLNEIKDFLDKMDVIAKAEDLGALPPMIGQASSIPAKVSSLQSHASTIDSVTAMIGNIVAIPPYMQQTLYPDPGHREYNRLSEFLRWHYPANFASQLVNNASTPRQKAFAYGYLSHFAASVTGEPFVNNVSGGPYRLRWWRNRLVSNFVDSWTFGFFKSGAEMDEDKPSPPYAAWRPLCSANLQEEINVAGLLGAKSYDVPEAVKAVASGNLGNLPNQFPDDLAKLLNDAVNSAYPTDRPMALSFTGGGFSESRFKEAFVGAFAVYWFMTSGSGPMCNNPIGSPPANCMSAPSWISSGAPQSPQEAGLNTTGATCAILLAMVALLLILTGNIPAGITALIGALNAPIVNWDEVRCNLFWLRKLMVDAENDLRDQLIMGGLAYPPPYQLGTIDANGNTQPVIDKTPGGGVPLCLSNNFDTPAYPRIMDDTILTLPDLNFACYPPTVMETPSAQNLIPLNVYPNFVVDGTGPGPGPGLQNGGILSDLSTLPSSNQLFGDAVSNAVQVIENNGNNLQNYNLDADRGYGWKTWTPKGTWTAGDLPLLYDPEL